MNKSEIEQLKQSVKEQEKTKGIHTPYTESSGRLPDFEVEYEFDIDSELAGIKPGQGMRSDFLYEGDDPVKDGIYMIWPEFLDEEGSVIRNKYLITSNLGKATMWIGSHEMREKIHREKIQVGTKGFWVIGSKKIAKVTVTKIIGLFINNK